MTAKTASEPSLNHVGQSEWVIILGGLALLGPLSVDAYLPAFSAIEHDLVAGSESVQFTLTGYLFAFAAMSLFHGVLSDALGRRRLVLASLVMFSVANLGCAVSPDIAWLSTFRIAQGLCAGAGTVVGRAIIRDQFNGAAATRLLAIVSMVFSLSPALAPVLGGWIVERASWRGIFLFMFVYTSVLSLFCVRNLPETLPIHARQVFRPIDLLHQYGNVFLHREFTMGALAISFSFAGLFIYVASAPAFVGQELRLPNNAYAWLFVPIVAGIFLGSWASERLAMSTRAKTLVISGFAIQVVSTMANSAFHVFHPAALLWSVLPLFFYAFGMSLVTPSLTLAGLDLFPAFRGLAASCQSFAMLTLAGIVTHFAPHLGGRAWELALAQCVLCLVAIGLGLAARSKNLGPSQ